jgi:hypothetical protein
MTSKAPLFAPWQTAATHLGALRLIDWKRVAWSSLASIVLHEAIFSYSYLAVAQQARQSLQVAGIDSPLGAAITGGAAAGALGAIVSFTTGFCGCAFGAKCSSTDECGRSIAFISYAHAPGSNHYAVVPNGLAPNLWYVAVVAMELTCVRFSNTLKAERVGYEAYPFFSY